MTKKRKRVGRPVPRNPSLCVKYARVSSKEQEKEGYSIPAQIKLVDEYERRQKMTCMKTFVDVETAKQSGRTAFGEMVTYLKKNRHVGSILVEKTERLYRNHKDALELDELGVEIHFVKEWSIISEDSKSSEKFIHGIRVLIAKQYSDNLSEEVQKGMMEKASQGLWPTKAPFGYINVDGSDGKKIIGPDGKNCHIVQIIFNWYLYEELTIDDAVIRLRENGYTKNSTRFSKSYVSYILKNMIYSGDFYWKGVFCKGIHEPLISREEWRRVQEKMDGRANCKGHGQRSFAFSGLIKCAVCGSSVVAEEKKKKYIYYHLSAYPDQCIGDPKICKRDWVKEKDLEVYFNELLASLEFDENLLLWLREALLASDSEKRAERQRAIRRLQGEDSRLANRLEKLYVDKLDGSVDPEFFSELATKWSGERENLKGQIETLAHEEKTYLEEGIQIVDFVRSAHRLFEKQPPSEKRRLLNFVLSNCTWERGQLCTNLRQPFDFLAKTIDETRSGESSKIKKKRQNEIWLGNLDSNQD